MSAEKETPTVGTAGANEEKNLNPHGASSSVPTDNTEARLQHKRFATLQARLALKGYVLRRIDDGTFVCSRWGMFRELADLAAVERFVAQVGAA